MTAPATTPLSHRRVLEALSGLLLGMFVSMIATTVVSTSLPVIVHDLGGDQQGFTWVITATLLTTAITTPIWGKLADLLNGKVLIQIALVIFIAASAAAGLSGDIGTLIAFRAVQGVGAGGLAALSQILMAEILSPRERGRYMGLFGAVMAVATVGGPLLGGFLTDAIDWRWNFYVAVPFAIVAFVIIQRTMPKTSPARGRVRIDYLGIVLLSAAVSLLLIWITGAGSTFDWWSVETALMLGGALLSAALFVLVELRTAEPLVPLSLFRDRTFTLSVSASIAIGVSMFGTSAFLSQYMQMARGATPTQAGLLTLPMIAGLLGTSIVVGQLISRYGRWKSFVVAGGVLLVIGSALLTTLHYDTPFVLVSLYMFLLGAGVGATMQNLVLIVQNTAKPADLGAASSGVAFFRSLGGTIGVSVMGAALSSSVAQLFTDRSADIATALKGLGARGGELAAQFQSGTLPAVHDLPQAIRIVVEDIYASGISSAFLIGVPLAVVTLLAVIFLPNVPLTRMTAKERRDTPEAQLIAASAAPALEVAAASTGTITLTDTAESRESATPEDTPR